MEQNNCYLSVHSALHVALLPAEYNFIMTMVLLVTSHKLLYRLNCANLYIFFAF